MANRMKERYVAEIAPALNKKFGYKSVMQIPKLDKVIVNVRCGESKNNAKEIEAIVKDLGISPARRPSSARPASPSLTSSPVRARTSALRSPCAAPRCTSSWAASSPWMRAIRAAI